MKEFRIVVLLLCLVASAPVSATAQVPDSIVIDGKAYDLNTNPLTSYLQGRHDFIPKDAVRSSANWRGYVAMWEINADRLLLIRVNVTLYDERTEQESERNVMDALFPGQSRVEARWYTGALIIPDGKMTRYVHMGYGSTYDHYRIYRINHGRVLEALSLSEKEFVTYRARKFEAFKKTDDYRRALADLEKDGTTMSDADMDGFMMSFFAEEYLAR